MIKREFEITKEGRIRFLTSQLEVKKNSPTAITRANCLHQFR